MIFGKIFSDEEDFVYFCLVFFEIKDNKCFYGYVFKCLELFSLILCICLCIEIDWCFFINFKVFFKDEENGMCELNEYFIVDENIGFNDEEGVIFLMFIKVICYKLFLVVYISLSVCDNC